MDRFSLLAAALLVAIPGAAPAAARESAPQLPDARARPALVLQITVDQLRGDMLSRYHARFGPDGFRRLADRGTWYTNAHYGTSNTITCSGHAVLVTGADTAEHGIVGNVWFDRERGGRRYCTADPAVKNLDEPGDEDGGMSPVGLTASTLGDELVEARSSPGSVSRVFAVAGKDRSSVVPGGHLGKAYWFSERNGGFVTSSFYYPALPAWVERWNALRPIDKYRDRQWALARKESTYHAAARAGNEHAHSPRTLGKAFPHAPQAASERDFIDMFRFTPMLDELTAEFVRELVMQEKIGRRGATDYLAISFSSTDYVGHAFGPNSVEYEDNLIRLDASLASLFAFLDREIGAGRTLIVLSADHGADEVPEERAAHHFDAARLPGGKSLRESANAFLKEKFGADDLIVAYEPPGLYLDYARIEAAKLDRAAVESALADYALRIPGVAHAFTRTALLNGAVPPTALGRRVARGFHPTRSGDVTLIQKQFWYMDTNADRYAAMHGSPYAYDTYVPVIFYGPGIPARRIARDVEPASIAPTLAALLGIPPPSAASAPVLMEIAASN